MNFVSVTLKQPLFESSDDQRWKPNMPATVLGVDELYVEDYLETLIESGHTIITNENNRTTVYMSYIDNDLMEIATVTK